jgi:methionyl-tRNA formyltransferase
MIASPHDVVGVVTQPDRPFGRGRKVRVGPIKQIAINAGIPIMQPKIVNDARTTDAILAFRPELGIVVAFGQKIGNVLLDSIPYGCINLHGSILPNYRGAAPVNWAIVNREKETGQTVIQLVEALDAGPIWASAKTPIGETETAGELHDRLAGMGPQVVAESLERIATGDEAPVEQNHREASKAPKLSKDSGRIDFHHPAEELVGLINGLWPWPAVRCVFEKHNEQAQREVQLARAAVAQPSGAETAPPGTFLGNGRIAAAPGVIELLEIKAAGGRLISMSEFINGFHVEFGDRFAPLE